MNTPALDAQFSLAVGGRANSFEVDATLSLDQGVLVLFGPSGSGKSLTLQALAGILRPREGFIRVRGRTVFDSTQGVHVAAHRRKIGYVPQQSSLFPFRNVSDNIAFGLPRRERRRHSPAVKELLRELRIEHLADARPSDLSGGERQRVALARALVVRPELILLDEPFAFIDLQGRRALREVLDAALKRHAIPAVFVTHDPVEAQSLGTKVIRFERGRTAGTQPMGQLLERSIVQITGRPAESVEISKDGRHRVRMDDVTMDVPPELVRHCNGNVDLTLTTIEDDVARRPREDRDDDAIRDASQEGP